jgi:hypothetical protein
MFLVATIGEGDWKRYRITVAWYQDSCASSINLQKIPLWTLTISSFPTIRLENEKQGNATE